MSSFESKGKLHTYEENQYIAKKIILASGIPKGPGWPTVVKIAGYNTVLLSPGINSFLYKDALNAGLVGLQIVNNLRAECPNFVYTYYMFNDPEILYVIREFVPGIILREYLEQCTVDQFVSVIIQSLLALKFAYDKYKFVHNDFHSDNVIVHTLNKWINLSYAETPLQVNNLAMIIDFDYSKPNSTEHQLKDIHNLIMKCVEDIIDEYPDRMDLLDTCQHMYSFFANNDIREEIELYKEGGKGFTANVAANIDSLDLESFTKFMLDSYLVK